MTPRHDRLLGGGPWAPVFVERAGGGLSAPSPEPYPLRELRRLTREAIRLLQCDRAGIWRVDPDGGTPVCLVRYDRGEDRHVENSPYPDDMGLETARLLRRLAVLSVEDVSTSPPPADPLLRYLEGEGIGAILAAPIRPKNRLAGFMAFESTSGPRHWDAGDRDRAIVLARKIEKLWTSSMDSGDAIFRSSQKASREAESKSEQDDVSVAEPETRPPERSEAEPPRTVGPGAIVGEPAEQPSNEVMPRHDLHFRLRRLRSMEGVGILGVHVARELGHLMEMQAGHFSLVEQALRESGQDPDLLADARGAGEAARERVMQFLQWSRVGDSRRHPIELNDLLGRLAVRLGKVTGDRVGLLLAPSSEPLTIRAHLHLLERALEQLVRNAREASEDGSRVRVAVVRGAAVHSHPFARIMVEDRGEGIRSGDLPWIFEPFFTTRQNEGGSGFGLPLVQAVVEGLGGWVDVTSTPGEGTRFILNLPMEEAGDATVRPSEPSRTGLDPERPLVLVVEDDPFLARLVERALDRGGFQVQRVDGPAAAERVLHRAARDLSLIVVERRLTAGERGIDTVRRAQTLAPGLPAILLDRSMPAGSGDGFEPGRPEAGSGPAAEPGANGIPILGPPFAPAELLRLARGLVGEGDRGSAGTEREGAGVDPVH